MGTKFYEENDCVVYWDDANRWIYVDWRNIPSVETVKRGCEEVLKLLSQKRGNKVLNDNRNVSGSWSAASQWVAEDWFPRMMKAGLKKFAWIQSKASAMSQLSARDSKAKNQNTDVIHLFNDEPEAIDWLKQ
jgi:hypothetical protein